MKAGWLVLALGLPLLAGCSASSDAAFAANVEAVVYKPYVAPLDPLPASTTSPCVADKADERLLTAVEAETEVDFGQKEYSYRPVSANRDGVFVCEGSGTCNIPVHIRQPDATHARCQATLPYWRLCVRKDARGQRPSALKFYLADEITSAPRAGSSSGVFDYEFVPDGTLVPGSYGSAGGVALFERPAARTRRAMSYDYFTPPGARSVDGQSYTWTVGSKATVGSIGLSRDAVMHIVYVWPVGAKDKGSICLPTDPMIVHTE